jgi:hypothetical protein
MKAEVAAAVEKGALGVREAGAAAAEQAELFPLPVEIGANAEQRIESVRKAGRPPGAANRSSRELREWLLRRGVLPQAALMQWVMGGPDGVLAWITGGHPDIADAETRAVAYREWRTVCVELGSYLLPKQAQVDEAGRTVPQMIFVMPGGTAPIAPDARAPWLEEIEQNQALTEPGAVQSQTPESQP